MGKKVLSVATRNDILGDTKTGLWYVPFCHARFARITVLRSHRAAPKISFGQYRSCESGYQNTDVYIRLEELASPYYIWKNKGYSVTVVSIKGGEIPLDPMSLKDDYLTEHSKTFLNSGEQIGQPYSSSCSFTYRVCFSAFRILFPQVLD